MAKSTKIKNTIKKKCRVTIVRTNKNILSYQMSSINVRIYQIPISVLKKKTIRQFLCKISISYGEFDPIKIDFLFILD